MANNPDIKYIQDLNKKFEESEPQEILSYFMERYKGKIAFSSSLGMEDQAITHMIVSIDKNAKIFTLDTGRLFQETYDLIDKTNNRFGINIEVMFPDKNDVEEMVKDKGVNLFYESVENRKLCCHIRKIKPLHRALEGQDVWITGLRKHQSQIREKFNLVEWEDNHELIKLNPLINWDEDKLKDYIAEHNIPYNVLHDKGFPSIGCLPCTRAVEEGEDFRAGRWWWENPDMRECGLHNR